MNMSGNESPPYISRGRDLESHVDQANLFMKTNRFFRTKPP